jgi:hypothetical protein
MAYAMAYILLCYKNIQRLLQILRVKDNLMSEHNWKPVTTVQGELQAEVVRGLLEAQGIPVFLSQEGVARAYGLGVGPLSEVEIMVPENFEVAAQDVIQRYKAGEFEELGSQFEDLESQPDEQDDES